MQSRLPLHMRFAFVVVTRRLPVCTDSIWLSSDYPALAEVLVGRVKTVFADYDSKVGMDD